MATKPFHLAWFLQGSSVQAWGEAWTGHIGHTWMEPELFLNMARAGACLLRLHPARRFILRGRKLRRLDRDLSQERHRRAASGPVGGGRADDAGDIAHRHRAHVRNLRLSPLPARPPGGDARSGVGRTHRLERCYRQLRLRGHELRHAGHAGARPALRHGGRIHGGLQRPVGLVGARRDPRRPRERRARRPHQGARGQLQRQVFQNARPAELRAGAAGPAGDRPGRRLAARAQVRGRPCRHHRRPHPRASRRCAPTARTCTST
jgi:hypothetical protein